jgi:pyridoxamine 5'-phosphate oxidase
LNGPARDLPLDESDLDPDPIRVFQRWFDEARAAGEPEPEAMALATSSADGVPSNRFVLLKGFDQEGFVFYTNSRSQKGREMAANPRTALAFRWARVNRQVRVAGTVAALEATESDAYFATRSRGAQVGAWASAQSEVLESRAALDHEVAIVTRRFAGGEVPRPPWWGGFRVHPVEIEFWQGRLDRLHDRLVYREVGGRWRIYRLNP